MSFLSQLTDEAKKKVAFIQSLTKATPVAPVQPVQQITQSNNQQSIGLLQRLNQIAQQQNPALANSPFGQKLTQIAQQQTMNPAPTPTPQPSFMSRVANGLSGIGQDLSYGIQHPIQTAEQIPSALGTVGNAVADNTVRPIMRGLIGSPIATLAQPITGQSQLDPTQNPVSQFIFGKEPIKPVQNVVNPQDLQQFGLNKPQAALAAPFLGAFASGINAVGLEGGAGTQLVKDLAEATTKDAVQNIAEKAGINLTDDVAKTIAKTTKPTEIADIIKNATQNVAEAPLQEGGKTNIPLSQNSQIEKLGQKQLPPVGETRVPDTTLKNKIDTSYTPNIAQSPENVNRGFVNSVKGSENVSQQTKDLVGGTYTKKPNSELEKQASTLLEGNIDLNSKLKSLSNNQGDELIAAATKEALARDAAGDHEAAAELFNNIAKVGTTAGRTVQAHALIDSMTPEGMVTTAARQIQRFNEEHPNAMIPELSGDKASQLISDMKDALNQPEGRARNFAIQKVKESVNKLIPSSLGDKVFAIYRTGLLTALRTPGKVAVSLTAQNAAESASRMFAAAIDKIVPGESSQGLQIAGRATGFTNGAKDAIDHLFTGYVNPGSGVMMPDIAKQVNFGDSFLGKVANAYVNTIGRIHSSIPQAFYGGEHVSSILDLAKNAAKNGDIPNTEEGILNMVKKATAIAVKDPEEASRFGETSTAKGIAARANYEAKYATNRDENLFSSLAKGLNKDISIGKSNMTSPAKYLDPFAQIAGSIINKTVDNVPVAGQLKAVAEQLIGNNGKLDRRAMMQSIGRLPVGAALTYLGYEGYKQGKITLDYPTQNPKEVSEWQNTGKQEASVLINGAYHKLSSLGDVGSLIMGGAKMSQGMQGTKKTVGSIGNSIAGGIGEMGKTIADSPFLQSLSNFTTALKDPNMVGSFLKSEAKSIIPAAVSTTATATDSLQRVTNNWADAIKSAIPGLRETLQPKTNALGQPVSRAEGLLPSLFDPFYSSDQQNKNNPVSQELERLDQTQNNATPVSTKATQTIDKQLVNLTPDQLNTLQTNVGQRFQDSVGKLIQTSGYQAEDDAAKAKDIIDLHTNILQQEKDALPAGQTLNTQNGQPFQNTQSLAASGYTALTKDYPTDDTPQSNELRRQQVSQLQSLYLDDKVSDDDKNAAYQKLGLTSQDVDKMMTMKDDGIAITPTMIDAYKFDQQASQLPKDQANQLANELFTQDPKAYQMVKKIRDYNTIGISTSDITTYKIANGERAKYIDSILSKKDPQQANTILANLFKQGIITKTVLKQLRQIRNAK